MNTIDRGLIWFDEDRNFITCLRQNKKLEEETNPKNRKAGRLLKKGLAK